MDGFKKIVGSTVMEVDKAQIKRKIEEQQLK